MKGVRDMKQAAIAVIVLAFSLVTSGCVSERYAQHQRYHSRPDTLAAMTKQDVIALSQAKVSDDVIISQIKASHSYFELSTQDILDLVNAGVSDKVIDAMIKTGETSEKAERTRGYYYYPPYYWYAGYPYLYPWYSPFYLGFSVRYYHPFYGYRGFLGSHGFGSRGFGGRR
jgi:hypothetical protein